MPLSPVPPIPSALPPSASSLLVRTLLNLQVPTQRTFAPLHCPQVELRMISAHTAVWVVYVASCVHLASLIGCNGRGQEDHFEFTFELAVPYMVPACSSCLVMVSRVSCLFQILSNSLKLSEVMSRLKNFSLSAFERRRNRDNKTSYSSLCLGEFLFINFLKGKVWIKCLCFP